MSYFHLLGLPIKRKYNAVSLSGDDIPLLGNCIYEIRKAYIAGHISVICRFIARAFLMGVKSFDEMNFASVVIAELKEKKIDTFFNYLLGCKYVGTDEEVITKSLEANWQAVIPEHQMAKDVIAGYKVKTLLHIHPDHSVGHLHVQCVVPELATNSYNMHIGKMISLSDLITALGGKMHTKLGGCSVQHILIIVACLILVLIILWLLPSLNRNIFNSLPSNKQNRSRPIV
jgi:hypothetical protein